MKKWNILPAPPQDFYDRFPQLPLPVADLLYHRSLHSQEQIDEFLSPDYTKHVHDPFLFKDMQKAVDRIYKAMHNNEKIIIYGDYDADGVSASVILSDVFLALGFKNFDVYLPHRELDGYGLNAKNIEIFAKENIQLVITCDCGISNTEEVDLANEKGIDVIITDHHSIPQTIPNAFAILHPKLDREIYPDKNLAGGAVAFKLGQALLKEHKKNHDILPNAEKHEATEKWLLDMVAIASVADMVPLLGESRTLTKYGLLVLNKSRRIGMQKMLKEAKIMADDGSIEKELSAETIGYQIAPRINAAGRLDHANVAYRLLMAQNGAQAIDLSYILEQNNKERKSLTESYVKYATEQVEKNQMENPILFVYNKSWSSGIVGLVASRIKDKYNKPCIAMTERDEHIVGSGRSVSGFNMIESLQEMPEYFRKFGGHPMACGFTLEKGKTQEEMQKALTAKYHEKTKDKDMTPLLDIDASICLDDVSWELYDLLEKFEPFGPNNPKPLYAALDVTVQRVEPLGKDASHLKLFLTHGSSKITTAIGWRMCSDTNETNWCKALTAGQKIDILFEIDVNEWNGNRELRLTLIDIRYIQK